MTAVIVMQHLNNLRRIRLPKSLKHWTTSTTNKKVVKPLNQKRLVSRNQMFIRVIKATTTLMKAMETKISRSKSNQKNWKHRHKKWVRNRNNKQLSSQSWKQLIRNLCKNHLIQLLIKMLRRINSSSLTLQWNNRVREFKSIKMMPLKKMASVQCLWMKKLKEMNRFHPKLPTLITKPCFQFMTS